MNIIEFVGPPGVGKTTLYREIIRKKNKISAIKWYTNEQAISIVNNRIIKELNLPRHLKIITILNINILNKYIVRKYVDNVFSENLYKNIDNWKEYIFYLLKIKINKDDSIIALFRYQWLMKQMKDIVIHKYYINKKFVVMEESLIHKTILIAAMDESKNYLHNAINILKLVPLPYSCIFIMDNTESIYKRIIMRENNQSTNSYFYRYYEKKRLYEIIEKYKKISHKAIEILKKRNVKVKVIEIENKDKDIQKCIESIKEITNNKNINK